MKEIPLTQSRVAYVDDCDYELASQYKWSYFDKGYAGRIENGEIIYLHRFLMNADDSEMIDHKDGNGLRNIRSNLRRCTYSQNNANRKKFKNCSSKYKGVYWNKEKRKWAAMINKDGKRYFLGRFENEKEAGLAYNEKAKELFGEFAHLNKI